MKPLTRESLGWRSRPGILGKHPSSPQSVHALLGYFLKDRHSPTPFPGRDMLTNEGLFDWGIASPLEARSKPCGDCLAFARHGFGRR